MDARQNGTYRDWVAQEWAGEAVSVTGDETPHWNKFQWVGDRGSGAIAPYRIAAEMPEGETALSGRRHTAPAAHWAPAH